MEFKTHQICGEYIEVSVDEAKTGTMDKTQALALAHEALELLDVLLVFACDDPLDWDELYTKTEELICTH